MPPLIGICLDETGVKLANEAFNKNGIDSEAIISFTGLKGVT